MSKKFKKEIKGTAERPRLCVFRSNRYLYAQIVDDEKGHTLLSVSEKKLFSGTKIKPLEKAQLLGEELGKLALKKNIQKIVFDRKGYKYHGRVKALAEGARKAGLDF